MHTPPGCTQWSAFPRSTRPPDAIAGSRRPPFTRVVRPVRPDSGRRPDDAGLPDERIVLASVPARDGLLYFLLSPLFIADPLVPADSDAQAIALARVRCGSEPFSCDSSMEGAARAAGVPVTPLTEGELTWLVVFAVLPGVARTMTPAALDTCDLLRYAHACAGFAWAQVWRGELVGRLFEVTTSGRGKRERFTLVIQPDGFDPGPGFGLLEPDVELAGDATMPGLTNAIGNGRLSLVCTKAAIFAPLLVRALGTDVFPIGISYRSAAATRLDASEIRLLTGVLEGIADLTSGADSAVIDVDRTGVAIARHPHDAILDHHARGSA